MLYLPPHTSLQLTTDFTERAWPIQERGLPMQEWALPMRKRVLPMSEWAQAHPIVGARTETGSAHLRTDKCTQQINAHTRTVANVP